MKLHIKIILSIFLIMLVALIGWGIYLAQISPEAEAFFYDRTDEEQRELDRKVDKWIDGDYEKIELLDDQDLMTCIYSSDLPLSQAIESCGDLNDLSELIKKNQYLLDRYTEAQTDSSVNLAGQTNLAGTRIFLISLYSRFLDGQQDSAMTDWIKNFTYWNDEEGDNYEIYSFVGLAIHHVNISYQLSTLFQMLNTDFSFDQELYSKTYKVLKNVEKKNLPIENFIKLEFELGKIESFFLDRKMNPFFSLFQRRYLDKHYSYIQRLIGYKNLSYLENCSTKERYATQEDHELSPSEEFLRYGPFGYKDYFLHEYKLNRMLIDSIDRINAIRTLLRLLIKIKEENIPRLNINDYIKSTPDISTNPLTEKLFKFDENENAILLDGMECGTHTQEFPLTIHKSK